MTSFWYEIKYNLIRQWRYKLSFAIYIITNLIMFAGMLIVQNRMQIEGMDFNKNLYAIITYLFWNIGSSLVNINIANLSGDLLSGIFETKLLFKIDIIWLLFARMLSGLVICIAIQFLVIGISCAFGIITMSFLAKYIVIFLVYIPTIFGMFGISLCFCSMILKYKVIGSVGSIYTLFLFVINIFYPAGNNILDIVVPYTQGMNIAKEFVISGILPSKQIISYLLINILWGVAGVVLFKLSLKITQKRGYFNAY